VSIYRRRKRRLLKIAKVPQILEALFPRSSCALILAKHELGYILGDFIANSSGHPAGHSTNRSRPFNVI
jgi:hypothetical protein